MAAITSRGDDEACCNDGYHSGGGDDARVRQAASYEPERVTCSGRAWHAGLVVEVKAQRKGILELLVKNPHFTHPMKEDVKKKVFSLLLGETRMW
jgi:hypothetical protein